MNTKKRQGASSRDNLALNLQLARTILGLSQEQLALRCDLKRTYVGALERGEVNPGIDNLDRIAAGLGVSACMLISDPAEVNGQLIAALRERRLVRAEPTASRPTS